MKVMVVLASIAAVLVSSELAQANEEFAKKLAVVLAAEDACQLQLDPNAVKGLVEKNVKPGDGAFTNNLNWQIVIQETKIKDYSDAKMAAHCTQVRRLAQSGNLLKP